MISKLYIKTQKHYMRDKNTVGIRLGILCHDLILFI